MINKKKKEKKIIHETIYVCIYLTRDVTMAVKMIIVDTIDII